MAPPKKRKHDAAGNLLPKAPAATKKKTGPPTLGAGPGGAAGELHYTPSTSGTQQTLKFRGARSFRARLVLATLAKRRITISGIRERSETPGLRADEACFLRLLDKITSGSSVRINDTGTTLSYAPGYLVGGTVEHDCSRSKRGVGWVAEGVLLLAPFCAEPLRVTLLGATCGGPTWRAVDALKHGPCAWMRSIFGIDVVIDVARRQAFSSSSAGGSGDGAPGSSTSGAPGSATLRCAPVREVAPIDATAVGLVAKVRGVAYATRVSPALCTRVVSAARAVLHPLVSDLRVATDVASRRDAAPGGPGFGLVLVAETTEARKIAVDRDSSTTSSDDDAADQSGRFFKDPEALARRTAHALLDDLARQGVVDSLSQPLFLTLMALAKDDVSVATLPGPLSPAAVDRLRLIKTFFGLEFKLNFDPATTSVRCACVGVGYRNFAKKVT